MLTLLPLVREGLDEALQSYIDLRWAMTYYYPQ